MSHDYVSDLFGEYRGYETRYTPVEKQAIRTIRQYYHEQINAKDFAEAMLAIRKDFLALDRKTEEGHVIIDQDSPLWLSNFLAFKFLEWYRYFSIQEAARMKPELKDDPRWPRIMDWARHYEGELRAAMEYCLSEWDRIHLANEGVATGLSESAVDFEAGEVADGDIEIFD